MSCKLPALAALPLKPSQEARAGYIQSVRGSNKNASSAGSFNITQQRLLCTLNFSPEIPNGFLQPFMQLHYRLPFQPLARPRYIRLALLGIILGQWTKDDF